MSYSFDEELLSFRNVKPNVSLLEEVWTFDPRNLEATDGSDIAKYSVILGQYLIYLQSERNKIKYDIKNDETFIEGYINKLLTAELIKKYKTKAAASNELISLNSDVQLRIDKVAKLKAELILTDGISNSVSELIATFKRELTRREKELYTIRQERATN